MKFFNGWSIRKNLALLVITAFLPMLLILLYSGFEQREFIVKNAEDEVLNRVHTLAEVQREMSRDARRMLEILAQLDEVKNLDIESCNQVFKAFIENNTLFTNVALANLNGDVIASGLPFQKINFADRKHFKTALTERDFAVGEYVITRIGKAISAFTYAYPVLNAKGEVIAVLATAMQLDFYSKLLNFSSLPDKSFVSIVDHRGLRAFYYPPQPDTNPLGEPIGVRAFKKSQGKDEKGLFSGKGSDGINRIFAYEKVRLTPTHAPYLYVWSAVPEKHFLGPANTVLYRNLLVIILAAVGVFILAKSISYKALLTPINNLINLTHDFADGHLNIQNKSPEASNEIGQLTQSFYKMAQKLSVALKEIESKELRYRTVINHQRDILLLYKYTTTDFPCFTEVNEAATNFYGYTQEELLTLSSKDIVAPEVLEDSGASDKLLEQGSLLRESIHITKSGVRVPVEISTTFIEVDNEKYVLTMVHDLRLRKETERQLRFKNKMEAVGFMAGGIAHNFNNNLSIILGNIELSQMRQDPASEVNPLLENAKTAIFNSRDLVKKIITYSQGGTQEKTSVLLTTIINETLDLVRATLPTSVALSNHYTPDSKTKRISADASQIQEVLINLINNAVRAMDEQGKVKFSLEAIVLEQKNIPVEYDCSPGRYLKLSVQDSGCGMPAEMIDKIFDPFYSTKEEFEGAGMGLSTVQGMMAQHEGAIRVNSLLGNGTTFDLYFPIVEESHLAEPVSGHQNDITKKGKEHILFVDDEESLVTLGKELLIELGYKVSCTTDSTEALKMFAENPDHFDLVISDQTMPDLTGVDLIKKMKKIKPDVSTILCTGYSNQIDADKAHALGISAFVLKPLRLVTLSQLIRQVLDG